MSAIVTLVAVPFEDDVRGVGMGTGPLKLIGCDELRAAAGALAPVHVIDEHDLGPYQLGRMMEIDRRVAERVRDALAAGGHALVLAGNCHHAHLGATAALRARWPGARIGVVWFDARRRLRHARDRRQWVLRQHGHDRADRRHVQRARRADPSVRADRGAQRPARGRARSPRRAMGAPAVLRDRRARTHGARAGLRGGPRRAARARGPALRARRPPWRWPSRRACGRRR